MIHDVNWGHDNIIIQLTDQTIKNGQYYVVFCIHLVKTHVVHVGQNGPMHVG